MDLDSTLLLDVSRENGMVRIHLSDASTPVGSPLEQEWRKKVDWGRTRRMCHKIYEVVNDYNKLGMLATRRLNSLKAMGSALLSELMDPKATRKLWEATHENLIVRIDDGLVHLPWELLRARGEFLCLRWNMGRVVRTCQELYGEPARSIGSPLRTLVVADPLGDLPEAGKEGVQICDMLDADPATKGAELLSRTAAVSDRVWGGFVGCDLFHYAGHARYVPEEPSQSKLLLNDSYVTAAQILERGPVGGVPSMVFVNGCRSGQTANWRQEGHGRAGTVFGLAHAFLRAGAESFVGTFWEVGDPPASRFAARFYAALRQGHSVGKSVRLARVQTIDDEDERAIVWATYVLYGIPSLKYVKKEGRPEDLHMPVSPSSGKPDLEVRLRSGEGERDVDRPDEPMSKGPAVHPPRSPVRRWARVGVGVLVLFLTYLGWTVFRQSEDARHVSALIQAVDELIARGKLEQALDRIENALDASDLSTQDRAHLLGKEGRLRARQGDLESAIRRYEKALALGPDDREIRTSLCVAMNRLGRFDEARACLEKLAREDATDEVVMSLHQAVEARIAAETEAARDERRQRLLARLSDRVDAAPEETAVQEAWSSRPLTLAFMGLEERGRMPARDGETEALANILLSALHSSPRVRVVDRSLMELALEELDLGSGPLVDPAHKLRLRRLLSARVLADGSVYRDAGSLQVTIHLIETETTAHRGTISELFPQGSSVGQIGKRLSEAILAEIRREYPLQGRVVSTEEGGGVVLDLGRSVGLEPETAFEVLPPGGADRRLAFARLRVVDVGPDSATAEVLTQRAPVRVECRVLQSVDVPR